MAYTEAVAREKVNLEESGSQGNNGEGSLPGETGLLKEAGGEEVLLTPKRQPNPQEQYESPGASEADWMTGWS